MIPVNDRTSDEMPGHASNYVEELPWFKLNTFTDENYSRLIELSETTYPGREISNAEYLEWEYRNNPDGKALINVSEKNGKLVSQYILLPRSFSINNRIFNGSLSVNTLTHPSFRGNEFFKLLAEKTFNECGKRGILFTIGFPNPVSLPVIDRKKIFEVTGILPLLFLPLKPFNIIWKCIQSRKDKSGTEIPMSIKLPENVGGISVFDFEKDGPEYNKMLKEFNREKEITTYRSLEYLQWRYHRIPLRKYSLVKFEENSRMTAVAVFRARHVYGLRCCILVDFISISDQSIKLLKAVRKISRDNNLDAVITTVNRNSAEIRLMKKAGFYCVPKMFVPQKLAFIVRRHHSFCPVEVSDFNKWYLTFGDYDIF